MLPQQTSQIYMYTSFFKRERQYDALKRKIVHQLRGTATTNKPDHDTCKPRSLSVSDDMTRLKRKKISIKGYCHNKRRARYACIARSLSVSDNIASSKAKENINRGIIYLVV